MAKILVVDDDSQLRKSLIRLFIQRGHKVLEFSKGEQALEYLKNKSADVAIVDLKLPGMDGMETFEAIKSIDPKLPVIIITAYGTTDTAIEATKRGAFDYILKPFEPKLFLKTVEDAIRASTFIKSKVGLNPDPEKIDKHSTALIGRSSAMQQIYKVIGKVAPTDATVLIIGESGTGKELVAKAIYQYSNRKDKPFVVINCAAIPETLLESELFGYEKGAFTGALTKKLGKIELANGGTLFLDEIGDMPLSIQTKFLRLLQEKQIERLGSNKPISVDVRIIAATNKNLEEAVAKGEFREDLYYRLNVVTINLPPLRERKEDIPLLVDYFLNKMSHELNISPPGITKKAIEYLCSLEWPGNVRELENLIKRVLIFNKGLPITEGEIKKVQSEETKTLKKERNYCEEAITEWIKECFKNPPKQTPLFEYLIDKVSYLIIKQALILTNGNRSHAAKMLGLSRPTLLNKMEKYGLS